MVSVVEPQVSAKKRGRKKKGSGFINSLIDKLPFELHIPTYQYCGPGTNLKKRLARGDPGINPLDAACKQHDIAYSNSKDDNDRYLADTELQDKAVLRTFSKDASLSERATALGVATAMKAKRTVSKIGKGIGPKSKRKRKAKPKSKKKKRKGSKRKSISFGKLVREAKATINVTRPDTLKAATKIALEAVKRNKRGNTVIHPRTIKLPTYAGGVLPLIPIFAGLSALGALTGSTASIVNAINSARSAQRELQESKRHNTTMESIAIGKGYYLYATPKGRGYYLKQDSKNS